MSRTQQAGGAEAVRTITALGIANSQLRDALLQQDMQRQVLDFSLQEMQKLDRLLVTTPGLPAAEAVQLQQGVVGKLQEVVRQQQEQQAVSCSVEQNVAGGVACLKSARQIACVYHQTKQACA
jgi:hypothetical protein